MHHRQNANDPNKRPRVSRFNINQPGQQHVQLPGAPQASTAPPTTNPFSALSNLNKSQAPAASTNTFAALNTTSVTPTSQALITPQDTAVKSNPLAYLSSVVASNKAASALPTQPAQPPNTTSLPLPAPTGGVMSLLSKHQKSTTPAVTITPKPAISITLPQPKPANAFASLSALAKEKQQQIQQQQQLQLQEQANNADIVDESDAFYTQKDAFQQHTIAHLKNIDKIEDNEKNRQFSVDNPYNIADDKYNTGTKRKEAPLHQDDSDGDESTHNIILSREDAQRLQNEERKAEKSSQTGNKSQEPVKNMYDFDNLDANEFLSERFKSKRGLKFGENGPGTHRRPLFSFQISSEPTEPTKSVSQLPKNDTLKKSNQEKALIRQNYSILQSLKKSLKKEYNDQISADRHDNQGRAVDYKDNVIFGSHYYDNDNIEEYLGMMKSPNNPNEVFKVQQYLHPFELASSEHCEIPLEWWDLKLLATGTDCIEQFQNDLKNRAERIDRKDLNETTKNQKNDKYNNGEMDDFNQYNEEIDDNDNNNDTDLVFLKPRYPLYNPENGKFMVKTNFKIPKVGQNQFIKAEMIDNSIKSNDNRPEYQEISISRDILYPIIVDNTTKDHQWDLQAYITPSAMPYTTLYVPKYLPPIKSIETALQREQSIVYTLPLTHQELRKERKLTKKLQREEEAMMIKAGILPKPEPKMKLSTLYRQIDHFSAMGVATEFEMAAKKQIKARIEKHIEHNLSQMLTPEELKQKRLRKIENEKNEIDNGEEALHTIVYRVGTVNSPKVRKDIILNAVQQRLSGVLILCQDVVNIVIVEGGPRGLKKFGKYVMNRASYQDTGNIGAKLLQSIAKSITDEASSTQIDEKCEGMNKNMKTEGENVEKNAEKDENGYSMTVNFGNTQTTEKIASNINTNTQQGTKIAQIDQEALQSKTNDYLGKIDPNFGRSPHHNCVEVWQGVTSHRAFEKFHIIRCNDLAHIKTVLRHHNLEHYVDAVNAYI